MTFDFLKMVSRKKKVGKDKFLDEPLLDGVFFGHNGGLWEKKATKMQWKLKVLAMVALTFLTSSQSILTVWSKRAGKYEYSVIRSIFMAEALKCALSLGALLRVWSIEGVNDNNKSGLSFPSRQKVKSDSMGLLNNALWRLHYCAVRSHVMAWSSGLAGSYTEDIMKKSPSRNINVQNFWKSIFGMIFSGVVILFKHFDTVTNKGFFFGYSPITILLILNRALCWIATSFVLKYTNNIVNVYATSVAMVLTTLVFSFLYDLHLSVFFLFGSMLVLLSSLSQPH